MRSLPEPLAKHISNVDGDRFTGWVLVPTFRAFQPVNPAFLMPLEHRFLTAVVHAGLAKAVRGLSIALRFFQSKDDYAFGKFGKFVALSIRYPLLKLTDVIAKVATVVFGRALRLGARKQFLLEVEAGVLDINKYPCDLLLRVGDLSLVACVESGLGQADGGAETAESGSDIQGVSLTKKNQETQQNSREVS